MSKLSTLRTYIRRDFKRTDKNTEITQAINDMIGWLSLKMPHGNYKYQSWINTAQGREDYALPTTVIHVLHPIKLLLGADSADSGYPMKHITKQEYDRFYPNPNRTNPPTGRPSRYTIFSRSILVGPAADSNDLVIELDWSRRPTALSADADTPELGSEFDELIKYGALERLYEGLSITELALHWKHKYRDDQDNPVGLAKMLLDIEMDREGTWIGQVENNEL